MPSLKQLLAADLARQFQLEGKPGQSPSFFRFLARLLHFRYLPNVLCRCSRAAYLARVPLLPNLFSYLNIVLFGLEVTPKCDIGPGVLFPHPNGSVIGARRIGSNVTIVQGVMVGAITVGQEYDPSQRPLIGDDVLLNAGCKVLGPVEVGNGASIGANSVVLRDVPPNATAMGVPARIIFRRPADGQPSNHQSP